MRVAGHQLEPDHGAEAGPEHAGGMGGDGDEHARHVVGVGRDRNRLGRVGDGAAPLPAPIAGDHGEAVEQRDEASEDVGVAVAGRQEQEGRAMARHLVVNRGADDFDEPLTDFGHRVLAEPARAGGHLRHFTGRTGAANRAW